MLPLNIILRAERGFHNLFIFPPEAIKWRRRVAGEINFTHPRALLPHRQTSRCPEDRAHIVGAPNIVEDEGYCRTGLHVCYNNRMLSFLPDLLTWWLVAPVILRAGLGFVLLYQAYRTREEHLKLSLVEIVLGLLIIIGWLTQLAGLALVLVLIYKLIKKIGDSNTLILQLTIALSLLFLGAGHFAFAIDLPL